MLQVMCHNFKVFTIFQKEYVFLTLLILNMLLLYLNEAPRHSKHWTKPTRHSSMLGFNNGGLKTKNSSLGLGSSSLTWHWSKLEIWKSEESVSLLADSVCCCKATSRHIRKSQGPRFSSDLQAQLRLLLWWESLKHSVPQFPPPPPPPPTPRIRWNEPGWTPEVLLITDILWFADFAGT